MPKSAKKRREKAADFSKAKLKLGKGKQLASNAVDTSFKARTIALPTQSITIEKDGAIPITRRKQSFDDLICQLKHYSPGTRKDAIFGVRELFEAHPPLIRSTFTALVGVCVRMIGDEDASVRKALLSFLGWLLRLLPAEDLIPHVPLLLLFTTSAQTHIFPDIRIDAIRFLDLFLEIVPDTVVEGWMDGTGHGKRVLEGYIGVLNAGTKFGGAEGAAQATSTASVVLSPQSKLVALRSLSNFLNHALSPLSEISAKSTPTSLSLPTWYFSPFFSTSDALQTFDKLFKPSCQSSKRVFWAPEQNMEALDEDFVYIPTGLINPLATSWNLSDLENLGLVNQPGGISNSSFIVHLARTLYGTLVATYLDYAPAVFSPSSNPSDVDLQLLVATVRIIRNLYSNILQSNFPVNAACDELKTLMGYMAGYFPFKPATRDAKARLYPLQDSRNPLTLKFQNLNVIYCELTSLLVLATSRPRRQATNHLRPARKTLSSDSSSDTIVHDAKLSAQAEHVRSYVIRLLCGKGDLGAQLPRPLTSAMYMALLPTVWTLLNQRLGTDCSDSSVTITLLEHAIRTSSSSANKRLTIEFVARIALLEKEKEYRGHFAMKGPEERRKLQDWVLHLPKVLWELGSNDLAASEMIIQALLRLIQRGSSVIQPEHLIALASRLSPFFTISHATRGQLPGPFTKIPLSFGHVRRLTLDLCATIISGLPIVDSITEKDEGSNLTSAIGISLQGTPEEDYWLHLTTTMAVCRV
ncbi:hypothetical protein BJ138DRAFT_1005493 [Hygrophoropsis aurantiaca]|uniref:Uncharacterized protein n=1 Tax=Hygrophoropsis aurantiaca TaxID=72124 RepID=A0ACB8AFK0_9AGAM|nr:hypothetical protein BJ138DRAFT_1005493 [Hygrophoropsis aurantiaca]